MKYYYFNKKSKKQKIKINNNLINYKEKKTSSKISKIPQRTDKN